MRSASWGEASPSASLVEAAIEVRESDWSEFDAQWAELSRLQQAVLRRLTERSADFRPFEAAALAVYAGATGGPVAASDAQATLEALRTKGIVVRPERGIYTLEDASVGEWFSARFPSEAGAGG